MSAVKTINDLRYQAYLKLTQSYATKQVGPYPRESSDLPQSLSDTIDLQDSSGNMPVGCTLAVEDNNVRIAFGVTPSTSTGILLPKGTTFTVDGPDNVSSLQFVSATENSPGTVQIILRY